MPRRTVAPDRSEIVKTAIRLLATEGPEALSMRRLAAEVGASTQIVYTLFGSKAQLAEALYREGFRGFGEAQDAVSRTSDPVADLQAMALAYRAYAAANRELFAVMFTNRIPGFSPSAELRQDLTWPLLEGFTATVQRALEAGVLAGSPVEIALLIFATTHGIVSLELGGHLPPLFAPRMLLARAVDAALRGYTRS